MENNLNLDMKERIISALESEIIFEGKNVLSIIYKMKERSRPVFSCSHDKKSSGLLTPPNYQCIPFSQCDKCKEYFFPINFIEKILENYDNNSSR